MRTISVVALASILAIGCDNTPAEPDAGPDMPDACTTCPPDAGPPDSGPTGDGNDSFATATEIDLGAPEMGVINPPGDLDYYTFQGTAGQWIQVLTVANEMDNLEMIDTVVTLYDESMTRIAENDDSLPRANTDSQLITRLPADGTYYVLVQEYTTWVDEPAEGGRTFTYELAVGELNDSVPQVNVDTEAGDDVASAQALTAATTEGVAFSLIVGTFDDATDVDVYSVTLPAGGPYGFAVYTMPSGDTGTGSSVAPASIWITNGDGTELIARADPSAADDLSPVLTAGDYLFFVRHGGTAGANDFYVLKAFRAATMLETMETTNGVVATPEPLTFEEATAADPVPSAFIVGELADGDTDHFSFMANAGELLSIACGSRTSGSGVVDLTAALLDPADATGATTLATDTETATEGVFIEDFAVPATGTYVVRVTKASQDVEVTGDWYRCGVHRAPPAP